MTIRERRTIACLLLSGIAAAAPGFGAAVYENPRALSLELRRLEGSIKEGHRQEVQDNLPSAWVVSSNGRQYSIQTDDLKSQLSSKDENGAHAWLEQAAEQLDGDSARTNHSAGDPHAALTRILSAREFGNVRPPSVWERLKERIQDWLGQLLGSLFGYLGPSTGKFLWIAGAIAVVFLALWLYRTLRRGTQSPLTGMASEAPPVRTWEQWVRAARDALAQNDLRTAVHAAYWAGVTRLQDERLLPGDTTLTAREYLRLIPDHRKARGPFAALVSGLERFWYANRPASSADLQELFGSMEELGCRPD
jgi:hypothetical protein